MRKGAIVLVASLMSGAACFNRGCDSVTGPDAVVPTPSGSPTPASGALRLVSGVTNDGITGAQVVTTGGTTVITAKGYLTCTLASRDAVGEVKLVPIDAQFGEDDARALLFDSENGTRPIWQPYSRSIALVATPGFLGLPRVPDALAQAIATLNGADKTVQWSDTKSAGAMTVSVYQNPAEVKAPGAYTYCTVQNSIVISARIVFYNTEDFYGEHLWRALEHEAFHTRGIAHGVPGRGVMGSSALITQFTPAEIRATIVQFIIPPGSTAPDNRTTRFVSKAESREQEKRTGRDISTPSVGKKEVLVSYTPPPPPKE